MAGNPGAGGGPTAEVSGPLPRVVLTGRVNVGKSSIFNRIVGAPRAVVEASAGVTRDRLEVPADWGGRRFLLTDTGGLAGGEGDPFAPLVREQAEVALGAADVIMLVVDASAGITPGDRDIARVLRRLGHPVVVAANKADVRGAEPYAFYALGLGEPLPVSTVRGEGLGDVLDRVVALLADPPRPEEGGHAATPVAILGRPNVGKSSLVNRLVGDPRLIVSPLAGTTRDAIDVPWEAAGRAFVLVDTPGLRRPARVARGSLESDTARRSTGALARAAVAVILLDANEPCTEQDKRIAGLVRDRGRAAVVALNKTDLLSPEGLEAALGRVREAMPFLGYARVVACSAHTGQGLDLLAQAVAGAADAFALRMPTAALNQQLRTAVSLRPPASDRGEAVRILYAAQLRQAPPTVVLIANRRGAIPDSYVRYLENRLRAHFPLEGAPIRWVFRTRAHRALIAPGTGARRPRKTRT